MAADLAPAMVEWPASCARASRRPRSSNLAPAVGRSGPAGGPSARSSSRWARTASKLLAARESVSSARAWASQSRTTGPPPRSRRPRDRKSAGRSRDVARKGDAAMSGAPRASASAPTTRGRVVAGAVGGPGGTTAAAAAAPARACGCACGGGEARRACILVRARAGDAASGAGGVGPHVTGLRRPAAAASAATAARQAAGRCCRPAAAGRGSAADDGRCPRRAGTAGRRPFRCRRAEGRMTPEDRTAEPQRPSRRAGRRRGHPADLAAAGAGVGCSPPASTLSKRRHAATVILAGEILTCGLRSALRVNTNGPDRLPAQEGNPPRRRKTCKRPRNGEGGPSH